MDDIMGKIQDVLGDKESMKQISQLADMLGMNENDSSPPSSSSENQDSKAPENTNNFSMPDIDISQLMMIKDVIQKANADDSDVKFLMALRPLLKPESQVKIDKTIKIFKLMAIWPVIKDSGLLGGDLFGLL